VPNPDITIRNFSFAVRTSRRICGAAVSKAITSANAAGSHHGRAANPATYLRPDWVRETSGFAKLMSGVATVSKTKDVAEDVLLWADQVKNQPSQCRKEPSHASGSPFSEHKLSLESDAKL
jgi:hypothetical protein